MTRRLAPGRVASATVVLAIYLYLLAPVIVVVTIAFSATDALAFPPRHYSLRWFAKFLGEPELMTSLGLSLLLAVAASAASLVLGVAAAFGLARGRFRGKAAVTSCLLSPLMVPALVVGMAFLQYFALLGTPSLPALLLAHTAITLPYVVRTMTAGLEQFDLATEQAAISLGATRLQAVRKVTLPMLANSLVAAMLFAFIISFENLPVALFLSDPTTVTLPIRIYSYIEFVFDPTVAAASAIQVAVVIVLVLILERMVGLGRLVSLR